MAVRRSVARTGCSGPFRDTLSASQDAALLPMTPPTVWAWHGNEDCLPIAMKGRRRTCASPPSGTLWGSSNRRSSRWRVGYEKSPAVAGDFSGGQGRGRSADLRFFRPALYQLSYLTTKPRRAGLLAGTTGFEPATSGLTGRRELQTSPRPRGADPGEPGNVNAGRIASRSSGMPKRLPPASPSRSGVCGFPPSGNVVRKKGRRRRRRQPWRMATLPR